MHVLLRQKARALYANMKLFVIDSDELFVVCLRGCGRSILMLHYFPMVFLNKLDDSCPTLAFSFIAVPGRRRSSFVMLLG